MAEVAGLVLGVIPIVLEALKQYEALYKLCRKFRKCRNGIEELLTSLETQKIIFTNETRLLLATSVGSKNAKAMIDDAQHALWHDPATVDRMDQLLGDSKEAIASSSQDICERMRSFEIELKEMRLDDHQDKQWRKEARKRFKYAFSEAKLLQTAEAIAKLTKRYRTLRSQVQELAVFKPEPEFDVNPTQATLDRVTATQAAAKRVYEVLASACKLHTKHHAHFSLRPRYSSSTNDMEIKFQIAYRHLSRQQVRGSQDVLWFIVESVLTGTMTTIPQAVPSSQSSKRIKRSRSPILTSMQANVKTQQKRVKFKSPTPEPASRSPSATTASPIPTLRDLGTTADFCTQLRACCKNSHTNGSCIGWLGDSAQWRHRVIQSRGPEEQSYSSDARTLSKLLASASSGRLSHQGLPMLQRLQLAKLLTTATLNFHATPWMQTCWKSDDIFLYGFEFSAKQPVSREPDAFVEVPVDQQLQASMQQLPDALAPFVRNATLFNLAVMLLELAFEKPLHEMVESSDMKPGLPIVMADYYAAIRLSKEVSAYLGPRYSKIVEQCLFCTFGQGTELSNPALQNAIQRDVVSELDRLAVGFQQLLVI